MVTSDASARALRRSDKALSATLSNDRLSVCALHCTAAECSWCPYLRYHQAALQGNPLAQFHLGAMYLRGLGVAQSKDEACKWFEEASKMGMVQATENLRILRANTDKTPRCVSGI